MNSSFTDCCVRYGQECVYTKFSQGNMTLGEIYMTLIYGLIDPACLPSMAVIYHDNKVWCTDTRRLTLAKELERQGKWDVLELMRIHQVERNTAQYRDFVNHRLPAMRRRGFNGLTVQVSDNRGPTCCFNSDSRLRADLEDHIINDHLNYMTLKQFKDLAHFYCDMCHKTTQITCKKSTKASYYTIIRKCGCQPKNTHRFSQPWTNITLQELCDELKRYKQCTEQPKTSTLRGHPSQKPSNTNAAKDQLINNISRTNGSTSTSTSTIRGDECQARIISTLFGIEFCQDDIGIGDDEVEEQNYSVLIVK
ncbi:unnamed protein product [Rotaria sp. Silwood2]|nr:unnamed protein product [Rotaria sp. Silwood2]CAF4285446.1 unnamed protein product [Rotaria sp. Silwood2]